MREADEARRAMIDAMAREHRVRREAQREEHEAERWRLRVPFAQSRGLDDLAAEASTRAALHASLAGALLAAATELHREVERLRVITTSSMDLAQLRSTQPRSTQPRSTQQGLTQPGTAIETRLAALEAEEELKEIKQRLAGAAATP